MVGADTPDLTLILDLPVEIGLQRAQARGGAEQRFERMGIDIHHRLRNGFLALADADPRRRRVIDATGDSDQVADVIWRTVHQRFAQQFAALRPIAANAGTAA